MVIKTQYHIKFYILVKTYEIYKFKKLLQSKPI
jgi:hypothetical protein